MLKVLTIFFIAMCLLACDQAPDRFESGAYQEAAESNTSPTKSEPVQKSTAKYLAYIHTLVVKLEATNIASVHNKVTNACEQDVKYECVVLNDDYNSGQYSSGRIQLRVKPEGVKFFLNLATQEGEVAKQLRVAEDLSASILDNGKRIEQLARFEKKLIALESRAGADIDSLLKVASQLAETQTQLEYLQGSRAALLQRVKTDIININLNRIVDTSFLGSIGEAFGNFGESFTYAIEGLINAIAYIVPWTIFLITMFFIVRAIFRFLNTKIFKGKRQD